MILGPTMSSVIPDRESGNTPTRADGLILGELNSRKLWVLLSVIAIVQAVYFIRVQQAYPPQGLSTQPSYSALAVNLMQHGIYGFGDAPDIEFTTFRPPLYSVWLAGVYAVFGVNETVALALNNILLLLCVVGVYLVGARFAWMAALPWPERLGLLAAALFFMDPINVVTVNKNQADVLFTLGMITFFLVALRCFSRDVKARDVAIAALVLGIATLTRATSLYLWVVVIAAFIGVHLWILKHVSVRRLSVLCLLFSLTYGAMVVPWMVRNHAVTGNADFAGMKATHLLNFFVPLVIAETEGRDHEEVKQAIFAQLNAEPAYAELASGEREKLHKERATELLRLHPVAAVIVVLRHVPVLFLDYPLAAGTVLLNGESQMAAERFFSDVSSGKTSRFDVTHYGRAVKEGLSRGVLFPLAHAGISKAYLLLLALLGLMGGISLLRSREARAVSVFAFTCVIYLVLISSTWSQARLRMPIAPMVAVFCSYWLLASWERFKGSRRAEE